MSGAPISNFVLILTAAIWGFAFVAQRKGMETLDPFTFNALRFALGTGFLYLLKLILKKGKGVHEGVSSGKPMLLLGLILFIAASLQQFGIVWTSAGNAGFITGLYVLFVPLIGLFRAQKLRLSVIGSVVLAVAGLYVINLGADLNMSIGNAWVLVSAVFFAIHVQMVDKLSKLHSAIDLAMLQFSVCAILSFGFAGAHHLIKMGSSMEVNLLVSNIISASLPIFYGGIMSVGIAYTLQIFAQKRVQPTTAAIILCSEGLIALFGGWLLLSEKIGLSTLLGAFLLLTAMLLSILRRGGKVFLIDKKGTVKT
ncbi:MAG: DMT family transporter [Candidatus Cloacimonadaceae bacterium]|nr:DMT family transporter [Candidatus Cloacimonadaceae bacterium]